MTLNIPRSKRPAVGNAVTKCPECKKKALYVSPRTAPMAGPVVLGGYDGHEVTPDDDDGAHTLSEIHPTNHADDPPDDPHPAGAYYHEAYGDE